MLSTTRTGQGEICCFLWTFLHFVNITCFRFLVLGLVPMLLLIFFNVWVFIAIHSCKSSSKEMTYSTILLLIMAIFILCHKVSLNFYEVLDMERIEKCGPPVWSLIFNVFSNGLLPVLNCTINFFIYFLAGKKFRTSLLNLLLCRDDHQEQILSKTSFRTANTRLGGQTDEAAKKAKEVMEMEQKCFSSKL